MERWFDIMEAGRFVSLGKENRNVLAKMIVGMFPSSNTDKLMDNPRFFPKYVVVITNGGGEMSLIGFIFWIIKRRDDGSNYAVIEKIGVKQEYRRRGVGKSLIFNSLKELRCGNRECDIIIHCRRSNDAKHFYDKIGFDTVEIIDHYYSNGESAYEMVLKKKEKLN